MIRTTAVILALTFAGTMAGPAGSAEPPGDTWSKEYVLGTPHGMENTPPGADLCADEQQLSGTYFCWANLSDFTTITITIDDATTLPTRASIHWFNNGQGMSTGAISICGSGTLPIPSGANEIRVNVGGPATCLTHIPGTTGTVTVTLA